MLGFLTSIWTPGFLVVVDDPYSCACSSRGT